MNIFKHKNIITWVTSFDKINMINMEKREFRKIFKQFYGHVTVNNEILGLLLISKDSASNMYKRINYKVNYKIVVIMCAVMKMRCDHHIYICGINVPVVHRRNFRVTLCRHVQRECAGVYLQTKRVTILHSPWLVPGIICNHDSIYLRCNTTGSRGRNKYVYPSL